MPSISNFCANIGCECANPGPEGPAGPQGPTGAAGPAGETPTVQQQRVTFPSSSDEDHVVYIPIPSDKQVVASSIFGPGREVLRVVSAAYEPDDKWAIQYDGNATALTLEVVLFLVTYIR